MDGIFDKPILGPLSLRDVGNGLHDAIVKPIMSDEQRIYEARHANPIADFSASQLPHYGIPAAIQDIAHGGNPLMEGAGALPIVRGMKGVASAAAELARQGVKGKRAAGNLAIGAGTVVGTNIANRTEEIQNPGIPPAPF